MEKKQKPKPGVEMTCTDLGLIWGVILSVGIVLMVFHYSKPQGIVRALKAEDTLRASMGQGMGIDISLVERYGVPACDPLRAWTAKVEGKNLIVQYRRDWFSFLGLGFVLPILIFIFCWKGGELLDEWEF